MKKIKNLTLVLTLLLMFATLTACGSDPVKDDFVDYCNNNVNKTFNPEYNAVVKLYSDTIQSQDSDAIIAALQGPIATQNDALLEKVKAYSPKTNEVKELHNLFIKAVEIKKEGYTALLGALTAEGSDDTATNDAISKLAEADTKLKEFEAKRDSMMKDLGLVLKK